MRKGFLSLLLIVLLIPFALHADSTRTAISTGTGFVVDSEGYILTNEHVIHNATEISVTISDKKYKATVIKVDPAKDIALLKIQAHGIPSVKLGNSDEVQLGDRVLTLGYPLVKEYGVSVSANMGYITSKRQARETSYFWTDAEINPGNSGGPLVNNKGEVVGIVFARPPEEVEAEGVGFAIPINQAIPLLQNVPNFDVSQMGKATSQITEQKIIAQVKPAVVFIKARVQQPLSNFLPKRTLGVQLGRTFNNGIFNYRYVDNALEDKGIPVEETETAGADFSFGSLWIQVFDLKTSDDAGKATSILTETMPVLSTYTKIYSSLGCAPPHYCWRYIIDIPNERHSLSCFTRLLTQKTESFNERNFSLSIRAWAYTDSKNGILGLSKTTGSVGVLVTASINLGDLVWLIRLKEESGDIMWEYGGLLGGPFPYIEDVYINSQGQLCYVKSMWYRDPEKPISRETIITDLSYSSFVKEATSILPEVLSQIFQ